MQNLLINHCAPVLCGVKTGNLFNYKTDRENALYQCKKFENMLSAFGISVEIIKSSDNYSLIYVYRKKRLVKDNKNPLARKILRQRGYTDFSSDYMVEMLKKRIENSQCFPHEIGLFLGYPPEDVEGFIKNKGCDFKVCGYWKVYCNEELALKKFAIYRYCTDIYVKLYNEGKGLKDLVVAS
ncbi:MAG: DUF3793 family protein [Lachnospirales bacterium]